MTRSCSHCNTNGHNHRTCSKRGGGVRLFGVRLTEGSTFIKKSASMGNLLHHSASLESLDGYHSDDLDRGCTARRRPLRKKGVPWTEHEHMQFLLGLEKLGRGNWGIISRNYVRSRTPTQVASHAQKYFLRQSNANDSAKKKRPSLFDLEPKMYQETSSSKLEEFSIRTPEVSANNGKLMLSSSQATDKKASLLSLDLSLKPAFTPFPFQLWPPNANSVEDYGSGTSVSIVREEPMKELIGMSLLTLGKT